jgi:hypothetical protein
VSTGVKKRKKEERLRTEGYKHARWYRYNEVVCGDV